MQKVIEALVAAYHGVALDQAFLTARFPQRFQRRPSFRALATNPSLRAAFLMRLAARGGALAWWARGRLITNFSCDVGAGCSIVGAVYLPHPVGIVLGAGAVIGDRVTIFQHVTVGSSRSGRYPRLDTDVTLFPNSVIAAGVTIGRSAVIGAGQFVDFDVPADAIVAGTERSR